jgi:predicted Zn-dependent peptidase
MPLDCDGRAPIICAAQARESGSGQSTLSSRLGLKVRDEMGLTYGINSSFMDSGIGDGPFIISVTVASFQHRQGN